MILPQKNFLSPVPSLAVNERKVNRAVGARPTPVLRSDWVDATAGCACYLKAEHLQRTGSFKYRGATNAVAGLDAASAALGVVCHSSGNHGAALAAAAAERGANEVVPLPRLPAQTQTLRCRRAVLRGGAAHDARGQDR